MTDLDRAVTAVMRDCLGVKEGEDVLVVANPATIGLGERLRGEAGRAGADGVLALMAERETHGTEPPAPIAAAMAAADVVLCPTRQSLSHTAARRAATEAGARIATLPGITEEMLARVMSADMEGLRRKGGAIAERLTAGAEARITCADGGRTCGSGSGDRTGIPDAGELTARARSATCPAARASSRRSRASRGHAGRRRDDRRGRPRLRAPVTLTVEGGRLVEASGADGGGLLELLHRRQRGRRERRRARGRHQREGRADRQRARGREDPRHRPRRLRRLGGDRRHGSRCPSTSTASSWGPTLRSTASRSSATASCSSAAERLWPARGPELLRRAVTGGDRGDRRAPSAAHGCSTPLRRRPQPHRAHARRRAGVARRALLAAGARACVERIDMTAPHRRPPVHRSARRLPARLDLEAEREPRAASSRWRPARAHRGPRRPRLPLRRARERAGAPRASLLSPRRARRARRGGCARASSSPTSGRPGRTRRAGATLVTARPPLAAFNLELDTADARGRARGRRRRCARRAAGSPACARWASTWTAVASGLDQRPRPRRGPARRRDRARPRAGRRARRPRRSPAELVGLVPEAAVRDLPDDVPIAASTRTATCWSGASATSARTRLRYPERPWRRRRATSPQAPRNADRPHRHPAGRADARAPAGGGQVPRPPEGSVRRRSGSIRATSADLERRLQARPDRRRRLLPALLARLPAPGRRRRGRCQSRCWRCTCRSATTSTASCSGAGCASSRPPARPSASRISGARSGDGRPHASPSARSRRTATSLRRDGADRGADRRSGRGGRAHPRAPSTSWGSGSTRSSSPTPTSTTSAPSRRWRRRPGRPSTAPRSRCRCSPTSCPTSRGPASGRTRATTPTRPSRAASSSSSPGSRSTSCSRPGHSPGHVTYSIPDEDGAVLRRRPLPGLGRPRRPAGRRLGDPAREHPRARRRAIPPRPSSIRATWA